MTTNGTCIHGAFDLRTGCPSCVEAARQAKEDADVNSEASIAERIEEATANVQPIHLPLVKVKYHSETTGQFSDREYTYYSVSLLSVGDIVMVPVRDTQGKAMVTAIDVPEEEIVAFKDKVKVIPAGSVTYSRSGGSLVEAAREAGAEVTMVEFQDLVLRPGEDIEVHGHYEEAMKLQGYAEACIVLTLEDTERVNEDLSLISKLKKAMEAKRKGLLDPLKVQSDAIRETYTFLMTPVLEAARIYNGKLLAYNTEQERVRREQEDINRKRTEAAHQEMELKGELTQSVNLVEVIPEAPKTVRTAMGITTRADHWTYEIIDIELLPRWCMVPDISQLSTIAQSHHDKKPVPGVRFYNDPIMVTKTR